MQQGSKDVTKQKDRTRRRNTRKIQSAHQTTIHRYFRRNKPHTDPVREPLLDRGRQISVRQEKSTMANG